MKTSRLALPANPCGALRPRVHTPAIFAGRSRLTPLSFIRKCLAGIFLSALPSVAGIVTWSPNPEFGIARYEVSYGTSPGVHGTTVNAGLNTNTTLTGLVGGQTYYIVVRAVNEAGLISPPSAEVSYQAPNTNPANQPPIADSGLVSTNEDSSVLVTVSASDPDNNPLTYHIVTGPTKGAVTGAGPAFTYTPNPDANGNDMFTYRVRDGSLFSNTATVNITIHPVNDAPVATNRSVSSNEDTAVGITLVGTDKENDSLTYHIVTGPTNGILSGTGSSRTYTPNADVHGTDTFTYRVNDGTLNSNTATVTITIHPVNDAPVADSKSISTNEDVAVGITLSGTDKENDSLTYQIVAGPAKGTLSGTGAGRTYTPNADVHGTDTFTYRVNDGALNSNTATVTITIHPVNDAPVAASKSVNTHDNVALPITLAAADRDGDSLTFQIVDGPSHGTLSGQAPDLVYLPDTDFLGDDSFTFRVNDGVVDSELATVSITVKKDLSVTDFELLPTDAWTLNYVDSEEVAGYPATHAFDGNPRTFWHTAFTSNATPPPHEIEIDLGGVSLVHGFRYLPRQDKYLIGNISNYQFYASMDGETWGSPLAEGTFLNDQEEKEVRFTAMRAKYVRLVALDEANGAMHTSIAELGVLGAITDNGAPTAGDFSANTNSSKPVDVNLIGTDPDGDAVTYEIVTDPAKGTLSGNAPNLIYTPSLGASGADSFTYQTSDGVLFSRVATVSLTIKSTNRKPVAQAVSRNTVEAAPVSVTLSGSDEDGDLIVFRVTKNPASGKLTGTPPNLVYTPATGFSGTDRFTYLANDGKADSAPVNATIQVARRNSPPVADSLSFSTNSGIPVPIVLPATDADGDSLSYVIVTAPGNGQLTGNPPSMIYQPAAGFAGADSFRFTVSDGKGVSQAATIHIVVRGKPTNGSNRAPTFKFSPVTRAAGMEKKRYKATSLAKTASDPDKGDRLRFSKVSGPKWLNIAANGKLSGTPPADSAGTNRFEIAVSDGKGGRAETMLLIDVAPAGLPLPWEVDHIGKSGRNGKAAHKAGTFSLSQAGSLSGGEDSISFLWQTLSGDGQIIARVAGLKNGHSASRAGVMIRDSLAPKSRHVFLGVNGNSGVRSVTRKQGGDSSVTHTHGAGETPRIWVRMVRKGDIIRSYKSANGKKWTLTSTRKVELNKNCYIGLAVSGGGGKTSTGLFRNVKVRQ